MGRGTAVLAAVIIAAPALATPALADSPPPTVTIISPTAGATVSGQLTVTVQVTTTPDQPVSSVNVFLTLPLSRSVPVPADCTSTCQVSTTFDTDYFSPPPTDPALSELVDGPVTVFADLTVSGVSGQYKDQVSVTADNHRPSVSLAPGQGPTVADLLSWATQTSPGAGTGSPVAELHLWRPGAWSGTTGVVEDLMTAPAQGQPWRLVSDTSAVSTGAYFVSFAARTADGAWSPVARVPAHVDHGFAVVVDTPPPATLYSDALRSVTAHASYVRVPPSAGAPYGVRVARGETLVDGTVLASWDFPSDTPASSETALQVPVGILPEGSHQLTVRLTDSFGVVATSDAMTIQVVPAVDVTWSVPSSPMWTDQQRPVSADFTSATEPITSWMLVMDGSLVLAASTPGGDLGHAAATWQLPQAGWHDLSLLAWQSDGDELVSTRHVYVRPDATVTSLPLPSALVYGTTYYAHGRVTKADGPRAGQPGEIGTAVTVQFLAAGTTTWRTVTHAVTASDGSFEARLVPSGRGSWRAMAAARTNWISDSASVSPTRAMSVLAGLGASVPASARVGRYLSVKASTAPYEPGLRLLVRYRKSGSASWSTWGRPLVTSSGAAAWSMRFPSRGTWYVQVVRPATTRIASRTVTRVVDVSS